MKLRRFLIFLHDLLASGIAWSAAFFLRFNFDLPEDYQSLMLGLMPIVAGVHGIVFWVLGLYRGLWRYASVPDLQRILMAVGLASLVVASALSMATLSLAVPRSVFVLTPLLLVIIMGGSRVAYRAWREGRFLQLIVKPQAMPVLVLGAGDTGAALLRDLATSPHWRVVGLLDDDSRKHGAEVAGVKVHGGLENVGVVAPRLGVAHAVIAMPSATHQERKRALDLCHAAGISVMTVPAFSDIVSGKVSVSALRKIELEDLLGRDPVQLDEAGMQAFVSGKTVLVTGAGGSIGSELCRQISRFRPDRIVLLDNSEFALYTIEAEFADRYPDVAVTAIIGDAREERRMQDVFERYAPQVVFHAAAYKHVPLMEGENAFQAVENNVLSTVCVGRVAARAGTQKVVLVSTDKAVNPVNVMGASKRLAEMACQMLQAGAAAQFVIVRFGNVLGSTGSVVPRFREQIAQGGPVTVTHPDIERYFMTIPEAAQLVLQAGMMGKGGEIYVLDMGQPVRIAELAKEMIRLSGFDEDDIRIEYTGLRPGEKLYEEPLANSEKTLPTPHPKLRIAQARVAANGGTLEEIVDWLANAKQRDPDSVRARLRAWVPEYAPAERASIALERAAGGGRG